MKQLIARMRRCMHALLTSIALTATLGAASWIVQRGSIRECIAFGVLALGLAGWFWLGRAQMSRVGRHAKE